MLVSRASELGLALDVGELSSLLGVAFNSCQPGVPNRHGVGLE